MAETAIEPEKAASEAVAPPAVRTRGLYFVLAVAAGYAILHAVFRLIASDVLGEDDVIDMIFAQELRFGYDAGSAAGYAFYRQPPLYNWVLWAVQQVTGPRFESFLLIKYTALVAAAGFLYLAARRALNDALFALLTVESLALIYSISWRYHEGFTHEVGAMVAVLATTWLMFRIIQDQRPIDFVWLSLAMGLGFLTEPPYVVFLLAMLVAVLLQPGLRGRLFKPALGLAILGGVAIASPYLLWLMDSPERLLWLTDPWRQGFQWNGDGFWDAVRGPVAYLSPLLFILPVMFPGWLKIAWADLKRVPWREQDGDLELMVLHAAIIAYVLSLVGAVVFMIDGLAVHVLMPLFLASVIWLFGVARRAGNDAVHVKRFGQLAAGIAVFAFVARMANLYVMEPVCKTCRWGVPFDKLGIEMKARGFQDGGTIVSLEHELSGNLRQVFPNAKVVTRAYPIFTPPDADWTRGRVAYIWDADEMDPKTAQRFVKLLLPKGITASDAELVRVPWDSLWRETGYRHSRWYLLIVEKGRKKRIVNTGRERRLGL